MKGESIMERHELFLAEHAEIYGHQVWHYVDYTEIGDIHVVEYEKKGMELETELILEDGHKAERTFKKFCNRLLNGKEI